MTKHKALQEWIQTFLEDNYLYFQSADAYPDIRVLVPEYGDYLLKTDIIGFKYRAYNFVFIGYQQLDSGTSDVNVDNMEIFDSFNRWLEEQEKNHNYPDFGSTCDDYKIVPLQNMANLTAVSENGLAQYLLAARIEYREE